MPSDEYYLKLAQTVSTASKDTSRKNGAVIVGPEGEIRSTGYNGLPRGIDDSISERYERPAKYMWTEHSERNAIFQAARSGISVSGCSLYFYGEGGLFLCADCARAVIQSGIKEIVIARWEKHDDIWGESNDVARAMLEEAHVKVTYPKGF